MFEAFFSKDISADLFSNYYNNGGSRNAGKCDHIICGQGDKNIPLHECYRCIGIKFITETQNITYVVLELVKYFNRNYTDRFKIRC